MVAYRHGALGRRGPAAIAAMKQKQTVRRKTSPEQAAPPRAGAWIWAGLVLALALTAVVRFRLLDIPLERDEGEYAYAGQLILQGVPPYAAAYNMKMPGVYAAYAAVMAVFGRSARGIHLGLLAVNLATAYCVFLLGLRLGGARLGLLACAFFCLLGVGRTISGFAANAEHFVMLPVVAAMLLLLRTMETRGWRDLLLCAILLGTAFLMKQHAAAFSVFAGLCLVADELSSRPPARRQSLARGLVFAGGLALPLLLTGLTLAAAGVFRSFWFWTVVYAAKYVGRMTLSEGLRELKSNFAFVTLTTAHIWGLGALGLACVWAGPSGRRRGMFLSGFLVFSFLAVCPGLFFRNHYFLFMLPAVSLLAAAALCDAPPLLKRFWPALPAGALTALLAALVFCRALYAQRGYLFTLSPLQIAAWTYVGNPFLESLELSKYVQEHSAPSDRIAVLGSEPQIYFYADRRSATGHIYTYALMENQPYALDMQKQMIAQIESARPEFLIYVNMPFSWLMRPDSEKLIIRWAESYARRNYRLAGVVDIDPVRGAFYRWGRDAAGYAPRSNSFIYVFRKNPAADKQ